jgi:hypothetical protein
MLHFAGVLSSLYLLAKQQLEKIARIQSFFGTHFAMITVERTAKGKDQG